MDYMNLAIKEAEKAFSKGEVPVGVIIVKDGKVIAVAAGTCEIYVFPKDGADVKT